MNKGWTLTLTAVALFAALSACGRKGDLEPPPGLSAAEIAAQDKAGHAGCAVDPDAIDPQSRPIDGDAQGADAGFPNVMPGADEPPC